MSQVDLAHKSGIGFDTAQAVRKTGAITLRNLVALLRALNLWTVWKPSFPSLMPRALALLAAEQKKPTANGHREPVHRAQAHRPRAHRALAKRRQTPEDQNG